MPPGGVELLAPQSLQQGGKSLAFDHWEENENALEPGALAVKVRLDTELRATAVYREVPAEDGTR
jgi:hypothetical protein